MSRRWPILDSETAVFLILFVQWQTLGLTISKLGVEHLVFAAVSKDTRNYFSAGNYVIKTMLPINLLYAIAVGYFFSFEAGWAIFISILLDGYSLIMQSDLNGRRYFRVLAIANSLNYPLFFCLLAIVTLRVNLTKNILLSFFVLSSAARALFLRWVNSPKEGIIEIQIDCRILMAIQQGLNYLLFRVDYIILGVLPVGYLLSKDIATYVFLAKYPELVSGAMIVAGGILYPRHYISNQFGFKDIKMIVNKYLVVIIATAMGLTVGMYLYIEIWTDGVVPSLFAFPFLLHALLIFPANNVTYSMLREGHLRSLIIILALSLASGLIMAILMEIKGAVCLAAIVPTQLVVFVFLALLLDWGKPKEVFDSVDLLK